MRRVSGDRGAIRVGLLAGFVLLSIAAGTAGFAAGQSAPTDPASGVFAQSEIDPDAVVMRVSIGPDGDAQWAVDLRVRLDDDNATTAFESVADDIERDPSTYTTDFADGMRRTVRSAENRTGRGMAMRNVTVSAGTETLPQRYGVVTYRFEWTGFAAVEGERVRAGDALSGLFLDGESSLVFDWPDGYEAASVSPEPDARANNSVTWHGPIDFGPNTPRVVVEPADAAGDGSGDRSNFPVLVAAVLVLAAALAAGWVVLTRTDLLGGDGGDDTGDGGAAGDGAAGAGGAVGASGAGDDEPPEDLLSNEEKVLRLLEEEGGRIKQQRIAGEFDWTDAKTSQVVGKLRDREEVETFRIGRENVVALPEESDI